MDYEKIALEIMEEITDTDEINENMDLDLFEAGLIDSLSTISIILLIEEKMGLVLQPTDFERDDIATVNNFIQYLKNKNEE
ncbi:D-alanine--poly(phosphoribitol) ligase subunit DltC [Miniphocaeibacter halophilus]|uniref:D-alanine--poly(Phosphoribitol) ligase subunit DltC n=1 Tax=Miniphocaeibacter halophilus TaxID=2931922 RepID=A0AC61MS38_9FIRM|nr:D-alanine--poly(phosphoribitol) ligase subunit DltC [Miniphocaeibacter halophilus]QQK07031.1 D-alanine--poly(phosphoribitol) ligase subunit DltC [Miniphocaeibacter halophilus]